MAIAPVSVELRGTRRVRTVFTGPLASGAFTATSLYSLAASDGSANPTHVVAVFAIANSPNAVEFAIDSDFGPGALYTVGYAAVPGTDGSLYTGSELARSALDLQNLPDVEPETQDVDLLLYGRDLAFRNDFLEDPTGDLLAISGRSNWIGAMGRRFGSSGLNWDPTYGPGADDAVESPGALAPAFAGALLAQARLDDRTSQATVDLARSNLDPAGFVFSLTIVGRDKLGTQTITVPPPST